MRGFVNGLAALALVLCGMEQARADIIYNLVNLPAYQNGYTLTGTVTTDGTLGDITNADILSWQWTATNGVDTYFSDSTLPGTNMGNFDLGDVVATPQYLALPLFDNNGGIDFAGPLTSTETPIFPAGDYWVLQFSSHASSVLTALFPGNGLPSGTPWWTDFISPNPNPVPDGFAFAADGMEVSSTPEPSTLVLFSIAAASGIGYFGWRRRKLAVAASW